jgi:DNA mismatch endonuclease (patch repair protein)
VMRANRKEGGRAELILRRRLFARGLRYRTHVGSLPGKPDLVFTAARLAVFCDGDFWHGRNWPKLRKQLTTRANSDYWIAKIRRNRARDRSQTLELSRLGWAVIRVWETDVLASPDRFVNVIELRIRAT